MQRKGQLCEGGTAAEGEVHDQGGGHNASAKLVLPFRGAIGA